MRNEADHEIRKLQAKLKEARRNLASCAPGNIEGQMAWIARLEGKLSGLCVKRQKDLNNG